jgi:mannose-P-dolichol utilization defect protein 1
LHKEIIFTLNGLSVFLNVISRLYQAFLNYRNGSTGALSAITLVLQFLGCVARIFTSIQETGDYNLIMSFVIASAANGVLVLQLFYYWNSDKKAVKAQKKKN